MPALRVHCNLGTDVRVEITQVISVQRDVYRAELLEPHRAVRVNHARVDVLAAHVYPLCVCRNSNVAADGGNDAVLKDNGAVLHHTIRDRMDGGTGECNRLALRRCRHLRLSRSSLEYHCTQQRTGSTAQHTTAHAAAHGSPVLAHWNFLAYTLPFGNHRAPPATLRLSVSPCPSRMS